MNGSERWMAGGAILSAGLLGGCGSGTVGIAASAGGGGGGASPPVIANFRIEGTERTPARIEFDLQNTGATVELLYRLPSDPPGLPARRLAHLAGGALPGNPAALGPGHFDPSWDFSAEEGIPDDGAFLRGCQVFVRIVGGSRTVTPGANASDADLALGNDLPRVVEVRPSIDPGALEASGIVLVEFTLEDTPGDLVDVRVEYDLGDGSGPMLARPAGEDQMPLGADFLAFTDVVAEDGGNDLRFFWDTSADLGDADTDAVLRFVPLEEVEGTTEEGLALSSIPFHVDNNEEPVVQLDSGPLITNLDERFGIPVPFRVIDEEGDLVEVIFQWRLETEEFPSLDADHDGRVTGADLDTILDDPLLRRASHIATRHPSFARGQVVPIDAETVRLPELLSSEAWVVVSGMVGRTLELLRPSSIPEPITPTWKGNPLVSPVAAVPVDGGPTALVLDSPGSGRLREIDLATGAVVREIAAFASGIPSAMTLERGARAVLVALDDAGAWRIERVELTSGSIPQLVASGVSGPVRGIASLGAEAAVFTAESSLLHLDYRDPLAPRIGELLAGLDVWGVAADPLPPNRLYVSERSAGRVLAVELDAYERMAVVVRTMDMQPVTLESPGALALEQGGSRLLIATGPPDGRRLVGLDVGARGGNGVFAIGDARAGEISSVAGGADGLRLVCLPSADELLVAGGVEQRRTMLSFEPQAPALPREGRAVVAPPFDPLPRAGQPWRAPEGGRLRASVPGVAGCFVWDSRDAQTGRVFLRAVPRDDEVGVIADAGAPKLVRGPLDVAPVPLGDSATTSQPGSVAVADLDGDGDQDLVSANEFADNLTVFFQVAPGSFDPTPLPLGGSGTTSRPISVAASDLDGNGLQDLVSANEDGNDLTVFFQVAPGRFDPIPLPLGGSGTTDSPRSVTAADLDCDGDQDVVSANRFSDDLTVFFQTSPGVFAPAVPLGGFPETTGPFSVVSADLDGDGDLDLASANLDGNDLALFFQLAPGSFDPTPLLRGGFGTTNSPASIAAADLDGDGDQDLVSANQDGDVLTIFHQLAPGEFAVDPVSLGGTGKTNRPSSVAAADLDGDGDQDLVSANADEDIAETDFGNNLTVFFQLLPGSFAADPLILGGSGATDVPASVAAADLDGDGDGDLVTANSRGDDLTIFFQLSLGSFGATPTPLGGSTTTIGPAAVAVADLDGDGDLDVVSANESGNDLTLFVQRSPASFGATPLVLDGGSLDGPRALAAADLDGDGDVDLVAANSFLDNLAIFFQIADGSFAEEPTSLDLQEIAQPMSVAASDLDGDGDLDLVSANRDRDDLTFFLQLAPGIFADTPRPVGGFPATNGPVSVAAADLDGDGDQDLVSANAFGNDLTVFLQSSEPLSFEGSPLGGLPTTVFPSSVASADLDSDGDRDIVSASLSNLTVFFQLSPGRFGSTPLVLAGPGETAAAADLDADGDLDLAATEDGGLALYFQRAPGRFGSSPLVLGGSGITISPISIAPADIDGDGAPDLVSANLDGDNLTIFWGAR